MAHYRGLCVNLVQAEKMLGYIKMQPKVKDSPYARDICIESGKIEFRNVCYVGKSGERILQNVSFTVRPNTTVAIVIGIYFNC